MTEVVYRLYETVDELTTVIENARSVPMSGSCMVPRDHLLDLLDDLRESLPEDVQAAGDPAAGERLFFHPRGPRCGLCHRVQGRGGAVGPDLSRVSRAMERDRLAESILEPSKEVAPEYVAWDITTRDGDTWIGRILRDDVASVTMLLASGQTIKVPRADIAHRRPCQVSLMPEGLQRALTRKEFRDLLAFLGGLR